MSGQLVLLTPIHSPMVTRPPSPAASAAPDQLYLDEALTVHMSASAQTADTAECKLAAGDMLAAAGDSSSAPASAGSSPKSPKSPARTKKWKSPPCCDGCGAAKASGGQCSGCQGRFCAACMASPAGSVGSAGSSNGSAGSANAHSDRDPCSNCSSLCNNCKPVACCFCEELRQQAGASRLCEACAGVCDACQRAACGLCRVEFRSCSSCGYAACEDCRLQLQLQYGASGSVGMGTLVGPSGAASCWCAPPLRMTSNVRHVSSQRYQMAQLHPSFLACSMEAAGLRDADYDDEDDVSYDADDVIMGHMATDSDLDQVDPHHHSVSSAGGGLGHRGGSQGLGSLLCPKSLEAAIGSLPGLSSHLSLPLSPSGSSHSSAGHYGSVLGHAHGLAGVLGYPGQLRHPEHSLRGWLDGSS